MSCGGVSAAVLGVQLVAAGGVAAAACGMAMAAWAAG